MIETQKESLRLSCGDFVVSEADFDISRRLKRLNEDAVKSSSEGEPGALTYFRRNIYPVLAAPASGVVPDVMAAYSLPRDELDVWWLAVWKLNPEWFDRPFDQESKTWTIGFRDGSKITIIEDADMPSIVLRLLELEDEALEHPVDDPDTQIFRLSFYPKMAACVIEGDVPPADVLRKWPSSEINRWYEGVRKINPQWFLALDAISEEAQRAAAEREKEKKKKDGMSAAG
jgi:hypothetical protein